MMKVFALLLVLLSASACAQAGGPYRESSNIAQFKCDLPLEWELDPSLEDKGLGTGFTRNGKDDRKPVILLQALKRDVLDLDLGFCETLLEQFSGADQYQKQQDVTKAFDDGSEKRFLSGKCVSGGKKIQFYIIGLQDDERLACMVITCNRGGETIKMATVKGVLQSLEFIKPE